MPSTVDQVRELIRSAFPDANVDGVTQENSKITGTIVWAGFEMMDPGERNKQITKKVRNVLGLRGLNVGVIYPLAPGEELKIGS